MHPLNLLSICSGAISYGFQYARGPYGRQLSIIDLLVDTLSMMSLEDKESSYDHAFIDSISYEVLHKAT